MKRFLMLLLVVALCIGSAACAKGEQPTEPADTKAPTETTAPTAGTKPTEPTEPAEDEDTDLEVTFCVPVATGVCVVGGVCSADCESLEVKDAQGNVTKITPDKNEGAGYFFGQVKISENSTLTVSAKTADGSVSGEVSVDAVYRKMANLMHSDEYMPVFGNDSRMHFYSAVLTYTLSDFVTDSMKTVTEKNITDSVKALKAANPDAELIYLVVPSSASVYPEGVPADYPEAQGETLYEAFAEIAQGCGATVIYPLDTFKEHRDERAGYKIFHNTDSHWTTYGAYLGVSELMEHISEKFPAATPRTEEEMGFYTTELWGGDALFSFGDGSGFEDYSATGRTGETEITGINELTTMFELKCPTSTIKSVYRGGKSTYVSGDSNSGKATVKNPNGDGLPTALILRDSFSCPAYDIVNDRFSTVWWQASHNYGFPEREVTQSKPDYVIYLVSERNLLKVMLGNSNANLLAYAED